MTFPVELLRFFDNASPTPSRAQEPAADDRTADGAPQAAGVPALTAAGPPADATLAGYVNGPSKAPATV